MGTIETNSCIIDNFNAYETEGKTCVRLLETVQQKIRSKCAKKCQRDGNCVGFLTAVPNDHECHLIGQKETTGKLVCVDSNYRQWRREAVNWDLFSK